MRCRDPEGGVRESMDKNLLEQYIDLLAEKADLERRIRKAEKQLIRLMSEEVADSVIHGRKGKKPLKRTVIHGVPGPTIDRKRRTLRRYKRQLRKAEIEIDEMITEVQAYIDEISDSRIRRIFRYRYIDKLTWVQVANRMGGKHTADSCRMAAERWIRNSE